MQTPCVDCPLRSCRGFQAMTAAELDFQEIILAEGESSPFLYTVLAGQGLRFVMLPGGERQVINFLFPGDFIGLQAGVMAEMKHSVQASSDMVLCVFNRSDLPRLFEHHPYRAYDLTWLAAAEEHFLGQALAMVGQQEALQRVSWAFARCIQRGQAVGLAQGWSMPFPYFQRDLADALGLSLVHTNKTLAKLRILGVMDWFRARIEVHAPEKLFTLAALEPDGDGRRPLF
jgi:CRP-like cAMP-binding protein